MELSSLPLGRTHTLAESEFTKAVYYPTKSDILLITFSPMRALGKKREFWGDTYAKKRQVSTLSFVAKSPHWYPNEDTRNLISQISGQLPSSRRRITYGFSMGAYAALKFSKDLAADCAIAFSPQFSIDPDETRDRRFVAQFRPANAGMQIRKDDLCDKNIIISDHVFGMDRLNTRMIHKLNGARIHLVNVPFAGHATINLVTRSATMSSMLELSKLGPSQVKQEFGSLLKPYKRDLPSYYEQLAKRVKRSGRNELAHRVLELGAKHTASYAAKSLFLARTAAQTDIQEAINILESAVQHDRNARLRACLARFLNQVGETERAKAIARGITRQNGKIILG